MVVGYVRVSTEQQAGRGVSLEAQENRIRAMAIALELGEVEIIVDGGESASTLNRPGIARVLGLVDAGSVKTVIVAKLDRLTRSVKDLAILLERFQKRGVGLLSVAESLDTNSAAGRLVINVMISVSQWEREAIGERTRDALVHKKSQRRAYGPTPYGFDRCGDTLLTNHTEWRVVEQIFETRRNGFSFQRIASELNSTGIPSKRGQRWYASTVRHLVGNDIYASLGAPAAHPGAIDGRRNP